MTLSELPFKEVVLWDFEFVSKPGERPDVVCLAWHRTPGRADFQFVARPTLCRRHHSMLDPTRCLFASWRMPSVPAT